MPDDPITRLNAALEGRYRIERQLGEGGMATVYLAEQLKPMRRQVALKFVKAGPDVGHVLARFEAERQALAVMDHPNLAKVFDAGVTEVGHSYFAMEWVPGERIDDFCDARRLSVRARLQLMIDVCDAVQHAHLKGVIHRDLKPSNVIVSADDSRPRVIDFGIAKAITTDVFDGTQLTRADQLIGTPAYMSPEQFDGSRDIDTRTDVYALGVLLYKLLVGSLPFNTTAYRGWAAAAAHHRVNAPKLAERLADLSETQETVAEQRSTSPQALRRTLTGDLQWIVQKAMEKDRGRRYGTAQALAADLGRYLGNEPIVARPPSPAYRLSKFVRRNRVLAGGGALAAVGLVVGAGAATVGMVHARQAEGVARQEAETSRQVTQFLVDLFAISDPSEARGNSIRAREILDRGSEAIDEELTDEPAVQATLQATMGEVYRNLGLYPEAERLLLQAVRTNRRERGDEDPQTLSSMNRLGVVYLNEGRFEDAESVLLRTLEGREQMLGRGDPQTFTSMNNLAVVYQKQSRYEAAERLLVESLADQRRLLGSERIETLRTLNNLAEMYRLLARYDEAEPLFVEALGTERRVLGHDHPMTLQTASNLASLYRNVGRLEESEALYIGTLEARRRVLGDDHPRTLETTNNLANTYREQGRYDEAEALAVVAAEGYRRVLGVDHQDTRAVINNLAELYRQQGRYDEAEPLYAEILEIEMRLSPTSVNAGIYNHNLALVYRETGRYSESQRYFERAQQIWEAVLPPGHPYLIENYTQWAKLMRRTGDNAGAERLDALAHGGRGGQ